MEIGNFVTGFEGILENYGKSQLKKKKIFGPKQFFFSVKKVNNIFIPNYCDIIPK